MDADWGGIAFFNDSGETVPAGALVEPTGAILATDNTMKARKPTRGGLAVYVNDLLPVPAGQVGQCRPVSPWCLLGVYPGDTVTASSTLGARAGDWYARVGEAGFRPLGPAYAGFVQAVPGDIGGGDCDLLQVTLPAFVTAEAVSAAINAALGSLTFTGTVTVTCASNGTATASVTLTRSGGTPVTLTGIPVTLEGCSLRIVEEE